MTAGGWDDASLTTRRTVVTPGGVRTLPVDVSKILTILENLAERMEANAEELAEADHHATDLKIAYEIAYANAMLRVFGPNAKARDSAALIACQDLFRDSMFADRVVRSLREASFALTNRMKAYQSVSAIIRDAIGVS